MYLSFEPKKNSLRQSADSQYHKIQRFQTYGRPCILFIRTALHRPYRTSKMSTTTVHTVLGNICPENIGASLTHEHLSQYSPVYFQKGVSVEDQKKADFEWTLENVHWIGQFP